ncbi:MAG: DUF465 domain-containing protein [Oceanidesulfovibrio sp.]
MEQRDLDLLEKHKEHDAELKALWEEHLFYEQQLEKFESKAGLSPSEQKTVSEIKKKKLSGKTKIQGILDRYRSTEN